MRIPRIYTPEPLSSDSDHQLHGKPAHYVSRVLRMQAPQELELFNGRGGAFRARITATDRKSVSLRVGEFNACERESPLRIHLGIGISRGERMDWVLQKSTELGVASITPVFCERGEVRLRGERMEKKHRHWHQILISACEQCHRNQLPQLNAATGLGDWLTGCDEERRLVLHHRTTQKLVSVARPASAALLIGPEGGLSDTEIEAARQHGFEALTLGPRVMRTETAPLAAISILQFVWGDLG